MPTGALEIFQFLRFVKILKSVLALAWEQYGSAWKLNSTAIGFAAPLPLPASIVPYRGIGDIAANLQWAGLHRQDESYLPKALALWQRSGKNPELSLFLPFVSQYTAQPFQPANVTGPPVSADTLNRSIFRPWGVTPITDADRPNWEVISAVGGFFPAPSGGGSSMTLMRGSLLCGVNQQGFSRDFPLGQSS